MSLNRNSRHFFIEKKAYGDVVGFWGVAGRRTVVISDDRLMKEADESAEFGGRCQFSALEF